MVAGRAITRVFIVDDHALVRDGLRQLIDARPDLKVVGQAGAADTALGRIVAAEPDVAVLDVNLPDRSGIELCRDLRERVPSVRSLMLTSFGDDEAVLEAVLAGAAGYVLKHVDGAQLVECVRRVSRGESLVDPSAADRIRARARSGHWEPTIDALTDQEHRILDLLADGLTNREIAARLYLSDKTVKNYVSNVLMKLGMTRRSEAAALAARLDARRRVWAESVAQMTAVRY